MGMSKRSKNTRSGKWHWGCVLLMLLNATLMAAGPDPEGLVLYLPCENAQNPIDASADPATVVVQGTLNAVDGQFGAQGLEFDGNNANKIEVPHADKLEGMAALSIETWIRPRNIATHEGMCLASKRVGTGDADSYNFFIWTGQLLEARVNYTGTVNSATAIQDDTWYHIAFVFDGQGNAGEKMKLYVNGVLDATADHPDSAVDQGGASLWIGDLDATRDFPWDGILDEFGMWNIALTAEDVNLLMTQGKAKLFQADLAGNPTPADGDDDVISTTDLGWEPGEFAATHNVYLGLSREAVEATDPATLVAEGLALSDTSLDVGTLDFGQTYYWRVDEVNGAPDFAAIEGEIWSFTVEPFAYAIPGVIATSNGVSGPTAGPENTVNGSGLNASDQHSIGATDMWLASPDADSVWLQYEFDRVYKLHEMRVWNYNVQFELLLGFGVKDVTIEYSADAVEWTVLGDVELAQATARGDYAANTTVDFGGAAVKYVRVTVNSGWSMMGQYGLSEVRFLYIPAHAREPQPGDGTTNVAPEASLSWRAGREAATHDVYLSTDPNALTLAETVTEANYTPGNLQFGSTYYWKIDEVSETGIWASDIWDFMTREFAVIDDMESYDDEDNRIYDTWLDGWVNETSSTVGYLEEPFAERAIVNSGGQSMPLQYDNSVAPFYSETERELGGMDLDTNGAEMLRLFVVGQTPSFAETDDGTILMSGIGSDIWGTADQCRYAYKTLTGNGSIIARVDYLDGTPSTWAKGGVMIRQGIEAGAINTCMLMTGGDGGGATYQQRMEADGDSISQHTYDDGPLAPPYWVRVTREGNTLLGYTSPDGETWTQRGDTVTLAMTDPVLIGLALTSHLATQATSAQFSNVSTTGNVTGAWQMAEIGVAQPTGGNEADTLYLALEDTAGQVAVVENPDASVTVKSGWTEWLIPYSELGGINLNSVGTIYIGVGDRNNPTSGGAGTIFIDDITFGKPAAVE
jgi:concanavalin A-like lectin/glucanase superfamily protein/F5/8 type C domain-containing protein